jgi:hypothetical protein
MGAGQSILQSGSSQAADFWLKRRATGEHVQLRGVRSVEIGEGALPVRHSFSDGGSPRAASTCHNPKMYFRPKSRHALGFGKNGSRGRDPSRRDGPVRIPGTKCLVRNFVCAQGMPFTPAF